MQIMSESVFFSMIVEPALERLPVVTIRHEVTFDLRDFTVSHAISRNVLTEFDAKLSDHMAAVSGEGMPAYTLVTRVEERSNGRTWQPYEPRHFPSMPHALKAAAELTLGANDVVPAEIVYGAGAGARGVEAEVSSVTVSNLAAALRICAEIGPADFLEISGDFDRMSVRPRRTGFDPVLLNLASGTITVPSIGGPSATAYQGALSSFVETSRRDAEAGAYIAHARHAIAGHKEKAIMAFRAAAEHRIRDFDAALDGQSLTGFRLEAATTLVARLQAGLGNGLRGLNEEAQITALSWAAQIRQVPDSHRLTVETMENVLEAPASGPRLVT